jgi:hypothetical protein
VNIRAETVGEPFLWAVVSALEFHAVEGSHCKVTVPQAGAALVRQGKLRTASTFRISPYCGSRDYGQRGFMLS